MPRFLCPNCGRKIIVHTSARGRSGACRGCGETIKIPRRPSLIAHFKKQQERLDQQMQSAPATDSPLAQDSSFDISLEPADAAPPPPASTPPTPPAALALQLDEPPRDAVLQLAQPARAVENPVTNMRTTLSVQTTYTVENYCRYTWSVVSKPPDAALPIFSINGSKNARQTEARFYRPGQYTLRVTITMADQSLTSDVTVQVEKKTP
jgi:hypothetical protein